MPEIKPWREAAGSAGEGHAGNDTAARQWLAQAIGDDLALAKLRASALALADGTDWSRIDDQQLVDQLAAALVGSRLQRSGGKPPKLLRLAPAEPPPPPPPPAAAAPSSRPAATAAPAPEPAAAPLLDVPAMVAVLQAAAQSGVPLVEECV